MMQRLRQIRDRLRVRLHPHARLIYLAGLAAAIATFIGSSLTLDRNASHAYEQLFSRQQEIQVFLARQAVKEHFEGLIKEMDTLARLVIPAMLQQGLSVKELNDLLSRQPEMHPDIVSLQYVEKDDLPPTPFAVSNTAGEAHEAWAQRYGRAVLQQKTGAMIPPPRIQPDRQEAAILTPVSVSNTARGLLSAVIDFQPMVARFILPIRQGNMGNCHFLDGRGHLIHHDQPELIGRNLFDGLHQAYPERLKIDQLMTNLASGTAFYQIPSPHDQPTPARHLISWNTMALGEERFIIALSTPVEAITATLSHLRMQILLSGCLLGGVLLAMSLVFFRWRAQDSLRESERKYRHLVESIEEVVFTLDLNSRFSYLNTAVTRMTGFQPSELLGTPVQSVVHPEDWPRLEHDRVVILNGLPASHTFRLLCKDGSIRHVQSNSRPVLHRAQVVSISGLLIDVTQRKQKEEQMQRHADELRKINEEVKQFVFIVSHDLRTPLVNLKAYARELQDAVTRLYALMKSGAPPAPEEVTQLLDKDIPESLDFIKSAVTRIDEFINAVMALARQGARELKPEPIDMNALVQSILKNLSHRISERRIHVAVQRLPLVVADRLAMEQIMGNILANAVNYLEPDRPGQIEVSGDLQAAETVFRIRDNGRGIAPEDMSKVFAPFRRINPGDVPGEGMGLAYVQTLVRRHGGRITCESTPGTGTTFLFTLPLSPAAM